MKKLAILASAFLLCSHNPGSGMIRALAGPFLSSSGILLLSPNRYTPSTYCVKSFALLQQFSAADLTAALADANARRRQNQTIGPVLRRSSRSLALGKFPASCQPYACQLLKPAI